MRYFALELETCVLNTAISRLEKAHIIALRAHSARSITPLQIWLQFRHPRQTWDRLVWRRYLCARLEIFMQDTSIYGHANAHLKTRYSTKARLFARFKLRIGCQHGKRQLKCALLPNSARLAAAALHRSRTYFLQIGTHSDEN